MFKAINHEKKLGADDAGFSGLKAVECKIIYIRLAYNKYCQKTGQCKIEVARAYICAILS